MSAVTNLFLADDDEDDRMFFSEVLQKIDKEIELNTVVSGLEVIKYFEKAEKLPHLIFLDYNMPVMNGLECLCWLKEHQRFKNIPVIMFTTSVDYREKCYDAGAQWYIVKPNNVRELQTQLNSLLDSNSGLVKPLISK